MRWPWSKPEKRESGGGFSDAVVRLIEAQAAGTAADASSTAAVEAAAGALSRAFGGASVEGAPWVRQCVTRAVLAQIGRDVLRSGASLHAIRTSMSGAVQLIPCSSWHWEGTEDPETWTVRATAYGPSTSRTWNLPARSVVFLRWGSSPGQPYTGTPPSSWAGSASKLNAQTEKSLADEAAGPLAQLVAIPGDGGDGGDDDPLASLKADIGAARGKALLVETVAAGWGDGRMTAPQRDWVASRLGPNPPASMVDLAAAAFDRVLAAAGTPPSLFAGNADGTSQREAVRRWHLGTVLPLAKMLEDELTLKLESPVRLRLDGYARDMVSRAQVFAKLAAVEGVSVQQSMEIAGLLDNDSDHG